MSEQTIVRIELNDLVRLCNERRAYKAEAERGEQHLRSAENELEGKERLIRDQLKIMEGNNAEYRGSQQQVERYSDLIKRIVEVTNTPDGVSYDQMIESIHSVYKGRSKYTESLKQAFDKAAGQINDKDSLIQELQAKNRKLKKKLKKAQRYGDELSGAAIFGESFEGIKCTFDPEGAVDECDHSFWLGKG